MNRRDQYSGLFWLIVAIFVCWESIQVGIGTFRSPGPGFLPFWSGVALGTLSIFLIIASISKKKEVGEITDPWKGIDWSNVFLVLISLFIYAILLNRLGYLIMTFGVMALLFSLKRGPRLWIHGVSALITTMVTYFIFYVWLDVKLPKGIFGF